MKNELNNYLLFVFWNVYPSRFRSQSWCWLRRQWITKMSVLLKLCERWERWDL